MQVILRPGAVPLPLDEQDVPIFTSDDEFITFFNANNAQDIAEEITADITIPLFRINLYISGGTKYMVVSINHVAYDGISIPVMLRNLASHYERRCVEHPSPSLQSILEELTPSDSDEARQFWSRQLRSFTACSLALYPSAPKPPRREHLSCNLSFSDISQCCQSLGISFHALCTAAYGIVYRNAFHPRDSQSFFGVKNTLFHFAARS